MTNEPKNVSASYLTHGQLGNHNAGEGGSNLSELKMKGVYPYISGQAFRHAVRNALQGLTETGVDCTPTDSCGQIDTCKICDIFGYFNSDLDEGEDGDVPSNKRWSPLKVTPLVGQYPADVTTDMVTQFSPDGDNSIAHRELVENVYRGTWTIDVSAVGQREIEHFDTSKDAGHRYERELKEEVSSEEKNKRLVELLTALKNACELAGQARHMADFMPDLLVASVSDEYNQRVTNALHVDEEERELNVQVLRSVLSDLEAVEATVYMAGTFNPEVISNWDEVEEIATEFDNVEWYTSVEQCFQDLVSQVEN